MEDRQLRLGQRLPVQVAPLPVSFTLRHGGVDLGYQDGELVVHHAGGITFFKGIFYEVDGPSLGGYEITVDAFADYQDQSAGTIGFVGVNTWMDILYLKEGSLWNFGLETELTANTGMTLSFEGMLIAPRPVIAYTPPGEDAPPPPDPGDEEPEDPEDPPVEPEEPEDPDPPANVPPVAAFTHSESDLMVSVNATTSTDGDGTITAYSWNWGDGSAVGSGSITTHTYAAAGTYTVILSVTDNLGSIDTASDPVTVTEPPPPDPEDPPPDPPPTEGYGLDPYGLGPYGG